VNPTEDGSAAADAGAERWRRVRALVAELFELPETEREERLAGVGPEIAAEARALVAAGEGEVSERFERAVIDRAADALEAEPAPLAAVELGVWRLTRPLGRGGMAEVWEAARSDGQYEQTVAVKLLKRGMDSQEIVARFRRERQILARLEHPAIARILDGGVAPDGRPYLVLEKIDGEPITSWCERTGADLERRLRLMMEACGRWRRRTGSSSSTATSSRRTSWSTARAGPACSTSGSPSCSTTTKRRRR
jgi:serine/threonine-protein kinase